MTCIDLAQALPDTEAEVLKRLREMEAELKPLAEQKRKIDTRAYRCAFHAGLRSAVSLPRAAQKMNLGRS